jgi:hypothetical protein
MRNTIVPNNNATSSNQFKNYRKPLLKQWSILLSLIALVFCVTPSVGSDQHQDELIEGQLGYFKELALGDYASNNDKRIIKWLDDINIFIEGDIPVSLRWELDSLIVEINNIISDIKLKVVTTEENANYYIFIGLAEKYRNLYPDATLDSLKTGGVFNIYGNLDSEIIHGSVFIDLDSATSDIGKFTLRKLLTHSLGIHHQSLKKEDSVFAVNRRSIEGYSDLDRTIIETLYSSCIKAGMDKFEVDDALLDGC